MGKFKQSLITTAGKSILLGGEVTYTSAKLFSQDVSSMTDDQVRALTALTGQLMSVGVSVEVMDNSTVSVKAVFSNKGLTDDLTFSSVGWFAKAGSGTETLIAVTPIDGTKLLCAGLPNSSTDAINIAMNMAIGDSTTVNVVIDPAGTVSPVDLGSAISKVQNDVDTKATKADVDKEITTLTADKANSTDITNLQNTVNNIDSTHTPIVAGASGDDLFAFKTNQIRLYGGNGQSCKNLPPASKTDYFTVQYIFSNPTNAGMAIYRTWNNEIWTASCNGGSYNYGWVRVANATDITNLQNQIQAQQTKLTDAVNEINYLKTNMLIGKHFTDEASAQTWENANPNGIAFIDK